MTNAFSDYWFSERSRTASNGSLRETASRRGRGVFREYRASRVVAAVPWTEPRV